MSRRHLPVFLAALVVVLASCAGSSGGDGAGPREWRDLDLVVPARWTVLVQRDDLLMLANEDIRTEDIDERPPVPDDPNASDVVAVQIIADGGIGPDDWRALVDEQGGDLEEDVRIEIGGLPATSLTYRWVSNDVPARERVVFVPSRELYMLLQPVPVQGQTNGPDVYLRHTVEFAAILDSIEFGRPFDG